MALPGKFVNNLNHYKFIFVDIAHKLLYIFVTIKIYFILRRF